MSITEAIQFLYERYLQGKKINHFILPEFADHLQLEITEAIRKEAIERRINQLSGSNAFQEEEMQPACFSLLEIAHCYLD